MERKCGLVLKNQCVVIPVLVVVQSVVLREQMAILPREVSAGLKDISRALPEK